MAPVDGTSHMALALAEARSAAARGEVPVGAVVVDVAGTVLAATGNRMRELRDPTAHAEMLAIRAACAALGCRAAGGLRSLRHARTLPDVRRRHLGRTPPPALFRRLGPEKRWRRAWAPRLCPLDLPSRARGLWRHRGSRGIEPPGELFRQPPLVFRARVDRDRIAAATHPMSPLGWSAPAHFPVATMGNWRHNATSTRSGWRLNGVAATCERRLWR